MSATGLSRLVPAPTSEPFLLLKENRFAYTALASLSAASRTGDPRLVYIFGPSGTGKSHLVWQFIRNELARDRKVQIAHVTASEFAAELAEASVSRTIYKFQARYRSVDILACEDIGSLQGRYAVQQQLLAAIDEILALGGRIVLTADRSPGALTQTLPKLVNRCHGAICAAVLSPDTGSRLKLLNHFARNRQVPLPGAVAEMLAAELVAVPRELLASLLRLDELARLKGVPLNCRLARQYLDGEPLRASRPNISDITQSVARYFDVQAAELRGHSRRQALVFPRQCAILLARELTQLPLSKLAAYFGSRHHSSISHACQRARLRARTDPVANQQLQHLEEIITKKGRHLL